MCRVLVVAKKKPEGRNELDGAPAAKKAKTDEQESAIQKELRQHNVRYYSNDLKHTGDSARVFKLNRSDILTTYALSLLVYRTSTEVQKCSISLQGSRIGT